LSYLDDPKMRTSLREPFPPEQISKLPATAKRPALDYVGHAAVTDRLNHACPDWSYSVDPITVEGNDGWPHVIGVFGSMTIGGVTRQEVGAVDSPSSYGQEMKEAISDFIRRGAMRFGVAIDLWSKEDLSKATKDSGEVRSNRSDEGKARTVEPSPEPPSDEPESAAVASGEVTDSPSSDGEEGVGGAPSSPSSPNPEHVHVHEWVESYVSSEGKTIRNRSPDWVVCECGAGIQRSKVHA
jgi:hypothetical protein